MKNNNLRDKVSPETEIKLREMIGYLEGDLDNEIIGQIDEIKYLITGLVGKENFEYLNLIEYKRKFLETKIFDLENIEDYLTQEQTRLLNQYKDELYESAIYGTPLHESEERREELRLGEELYFISKNIKEVSYNIIKDN